MTHNAAANIAVLRQMSLFHTLDETHLHQVGKLLKEQHYRKGQIIFQQGDPGTCLYIISKGRVRIYVSSQDGREATLRIYSRGASFGEFSVLDGAPRSASAVALDDVVTFVLYRDDFLHLLRNHFELVQHVLTILTQRVRYTTTYSEQLAFLSVPGRVAATLVQLASGEAESTGSVRLKLTQNDLASMASTTREWVNRALRDFATQGFIQVERGAVVILDRQGLQRQVY